MIAKEITQVDTQEGLNKLLEDNAGLTEIKLTGTALLTLKTVTNLVDKHHQTLQTLILDGANTNPKETFLAKSALLLTITRCQQLSRLALENFLNLFDTTFEHAIDELISSLPKLTELSFKNTRVSRSSQKLGTGIAETTSLKVLDLTGTGCMLRHLSVGIEKNKSLKILYLGKLPIAFWSDFFFNSIIQIGNNIQHVHWEPPSFEPDEKKEDEILDQLGFPSNDDYFALQPERRKAQYDRLCAKLVKLQHFLSHHRVPSQSSQLKVTLENNCSYRFDIACAEFAQQKDTLTHLIFEFPTVDPKRFYIEEIDGSFLLDALNICQHLQEISFINIQCYFGNVIVKIIDVLTRLPNLQKLTFTHTYLGERGAEALSALLKKNILKELKISHVGFSNENCFMILMRALKDNTSLKKLYLGSSPMTISWIRVLANFVFHSNNTTLTMIEWSATTPNAMKESMLRLCTTKNQCLYINVKLDYQLEQFLAQPTEYLISHWMLFQDLLTIKLNPTHSNEKQKKMMRELLDNIFGKVIETQEDENVGEGIPLTRIPGRSYT